MAKQAYQNSKNKKAHSRQTKAIDGTNGSQMKG